jgi:hypothetical protein
MLLGIAGVLYQPAIGSLGASDLESHFLCPLRNRINLIVGDDFHGGTFGGCRVFTRV